MKGTGRRRLGGESRYHHHDPLEDFGLPVPSLLRRKWKAGPDILDRRVYLYHMIIVAHKEAAGRDVTVTVSSGTSR